MTQNDKDTRIGIIGLGAIGVCVARGLQDVGYTPVGFALHAQDQFEIVTRGKTATFRIETHTSVSPEDRGNFDVLIFSLKNNVLVQVVDDYLSLLKDDGVVICTQNGLMEYFLASKIDGSRVLSAITTGNSEVVAPGRINEPIPVHISVGPVSERSSGRAREIMELFRKTPFSNTAPRALYKKWTKFLFSCVANPLSASTGMEGDQLFRMPKAQRIGLGIVGEILQLAAAMGVQPAPMGPLDPTWLAQDSAVPYGMRRGVLFLLSFGLRGVRTSMMVDIERGQKTEIEFLNGWVVSEAEKHGLGAPFNRRTVELVQELEAGTRTPDPANLDVYNDLS